MAALHPGIYISDEYVKRLRLNKTELGRRMGISRVHLYSIFKGKQGIGADVAVKFEGVLGIPAERLLALQAEYDLWAARESLGNQWVGRPMITTQQMSLAMS